MNNFLFLFSLLFASSFILSDEVELNLFRDIVGVGYKTHVSNAYSANVSFTHSQYERRDSNLLKGGFMAKGVRGQLTGQVGLEPFWLNAKNSDTYGISIGGGAKYRITPEFWVAGEAFYAPNIIVVGDLDNFYNIDFRLGYNILPHASVFLGYQNYGANNGSTNIEMYNGLKLGLNFKLR